MERRGRKRRRNCGQGVKEKKGHRRRKKMRRREVRRKRIGGKRGKTEEEGRKNRQAK